MNLVNGQVITLDPKLPTADCVYIQNGKISAVNQRIYSAKAIDLQGATVVPGFIDAHFHLANLGRSLEELKLNGMISPDLIVTAVQKKSKKTIQGKWIFGRGWDQSLWSGGEFPGTELLDEAVPDHPVVLTRVDGHAVWINDVARRLAQYDLDSDPLPGGEVINNCIFIDNAMDAVNKIVPRPDEDSIINYLKSAFRYAVQNGITGVHDAWQDGRILAGLDQMYYKGQIPIRCYGMLDGKDKSLITDWFEKGKQGGEKITVRSVKAFIDGSLGSRGAALLDPYCDDPYNTGLILLSGDEFQNLAQECYKYGFQLCTHAIGDRGNRMVLDTYAKILNGNNNNRWRIEHAQMIAEEDIAKFVQNDIIPSMQPSHCTSDMRWLDGRIGTDRLNRISRWKTFINNGLKIAGGSDCPIEKGNPILEFYAAVTRKNSAGLPAKGWQAQEKVSRVEALKMFTTWAAYGAFEEEKRGKIKKDFDADLTVLSKNILTCPENEIPQTEVLLTIVGGEVVYRR